MRWNNVPFRVESRIVRWWYRTTGARPSSAPFLSGDTFRDLARWRFESATKAEFLPERLEPNDLVYCDAWLLEVFLKEVAPKVSVPFRVLSHNGDPNFTDEKRAKLPPNVTKLLTQNCLANDPRLVPLPIGLENRALHYNGVVSDFVRLRKASVPHTNRILHAFTVGTNPKVRGAAKVFLEANPLADSLDRTNSRSYRKLAVNYRFIASPPGNGEDCHRTWEALYLRAIPIVLRSPLTEHFERLGLPLWLVDSYEELLGLQEEDLAARYESWSPRFEHPALWISYWKELL